ncbi:MAG: MlaD family protein [Gemmataceae bacterium]
MTPTISAFRARLLGIVVTLTLVVALVGGMVIGTRHGFGQPMVLVDVILPDAGELKPGSPVRLRGIDAGQILSLEIDPAMPDRVRAQVQLQEKYHALLQADASAQVQSTGLLGGKVLVLKTGTPGAGPVGPSIAAAPTVDMAATAEKLAKVADEADLLMKDLRTGRGTFARLVNDPQLYEEVLGMTKRANSAVGKVEAEVSTVRDTVKQGQETLRSVKQGTDALQKLPLIRSYVEDTAAILVRPNCREESRLYNVVDLFESNSAILTEKGKLHLNAVVEDVRNLSESETEVTIAALCDPNDPRQTGASATELTKKQAEVALEYLKSQGAHRTGWWSRRKMVAVGLGQGPSPRVMPMPIPPSYLQILLFTPQ